MVSFLFVLGFALVTLYIHTNVSFSAYSTALPQQNSEAGE